jgi:hypothetical protein
MDIQVNGKPKSGEHGQVVHPTTFAELRETLKDWITETRPSRALRPDIVLSSKFGRVLVIEFKLPRRSNAPIELKGNLLACQSGKHRLAVHVGDFWVKTALRKSRALFELTPRDSAFCTLEETAERIRDTKHPVFFTRALKAVAGLDRALPKQDLDEATSESTDYLVLLRALSSATAIEEAVEAEPLAKARLRGIERQRNLIQAGGGVYTASKVGEILNISRQAVDKRRREGRLLGLTQGRRGYAYPAWQFEDGRTMQYLEDVLEILQKHDPWMQMAFFLNKNMRLQERSPFEALQLGQKEAVLEAAISYGEHEAT